MRILCGLLILGGPLLAAAAEEAPALPFGRATRGKVAYYTPQEFRFSARPGERISLEVRGLEDTKPRSLRAKITPVPGESEVPVDGEVLPTLNGRRFRARMLAGGEYHLAIHCDCSGPVEVRLEKIPEVKPRVRPLPPLQLVRGLLRHGDALSDEPPIGHFYDQWRFSGTEGEAIQLILDSLGDGDHLELKRPGDFPVRLTREPDSGLHRATLPATGEYTVEVHLEREGHYALLLGDAPLMAVNLETSRLVPGETESGPLGLEIPGAWVLSGVYVFDGRARQPAEIQFQVPTAAPHLALYRIHTEKRPGGKEEHSYQLIAADMDLAPSPSATVKTTLPADSEYALVVEVDGKPGSADGTYSLALKLDMPPTRKVEIPRPPRPVRPVVVEEEDEEDEDEDEDEDDEEESEGWKPDLYLAAHFAGEMGAIGGAFGAGFELQLAPGIRISRLVGLELAFSGGLGMNASSLGIGSGLVGPALRFGDLEAFNMRLSGGLGWSIAFNGQWGAGPAGRLEISPLGRGLFFYGEAQTNPTTNLFFFGIGTNVVAGGEDD